uniref:Uncharacterized protein n=1 Tax=Salarias fasciatus TaxID=181472 RepID=A0A672F307_SALFA
MRGFQAALALLVLALLALTVPSSSNGESRAFWRQREQYLSGTALNQLYNSPVYQAERMRRPLVGLPFIVGLFSHSGVRVTLADNSQLLIHKGDGYGISSQTVVTPAGEMSSQWSVMESKNFAGMKTVGDFVSAGGSDYNLLLDNCHNGADRMMDLWKPISAT